MNRWQQGMREVESRIVAELNSGHQLEIERRALALSQFGAGLQQIGQGIDQMNQRPVPATMYQYYNPSCILRRVGNQIWCD